MPDRWVVNASPLILLGKSGVLNLLPRLCDELVVTTGVIAEVERGQLADAARDWLAHDGAAFVHAAPSLHPAVDNWNGGAGEAEVISWAIVHPGFVAVLDDRPARRLAMQNRVPVIGSLRVIVRAKERGLIPLVRPVLERLRGSGAYVTDELIDRAVELGGE